MEAFGIGILGLLAGVVGIGAGVLLAFSFFRPSPRFMGVALGFAAGIMLTIAFLELIGEAVEIAGFLLPILGVSLGMILFLVLDIYIPRHYSFEGEGVNNGRFLKKGYLISIGIALHNVPEGLAIGAGFIASPGLGWGLAVLIALHNIPEGLAMAVPLRYGGMGAAKALGLAVLAGLPMGIGAYVGASLGLISPSVLAVALGLAAGAMIYIVCDELIPEAYESSDPHVAILGIFSGVLLGLALIGLF